MSTEIEEEYIDIKKKRAAYFKGLLEESALTKNQLSIITGISNTYLSLLEEGEIIKVQKTHLLRIAFALNLSFKETNKFLNEYGYLEVLREDIPTIVNATEKIKFSGLQPVYQSINFDLLILSLERLPGKEITVSDLPSYRLMSTGHYKHYENLNGAKNDIYLRIGREVLTRRKAWLDEYLSEYEYHHLICKHCLMDYIKRCEKSSTEKNYIKEHLKLLIAYIEKENYHFHLIATCPTQRFTLKYIDKPNTNHKLYFYGQNRWHTYEDKDNDIDIKKCNQAAEDKLYGICTDSPKLFKYFEKEYQRLQQCIIPGLEDSHDMIKYLEEDIFKKIVGEEL